MGVKIWWARGDTDKVAGAEPPDPPPSTQFTLNVDRFDTNRPSAAVSRHVTVDFYWTLFFADVDRVDAVSSLTRTFVYLKTVAWFRCINTSRGRSKHVALLWLFQLVGPSYVVSDADSIFTASCDIRVENSIKAYNLYYLLTNYDKYNQLDMYK